MLKTFIRIVRLVLAGVSINGLTSRVVFRKWMVVVMHMQVVNECNSVENLHKEYEGFLLFIEIHEWLHTYSSSII